MNRHLNWHRTLTPGRAVQFPYIINQLEALPFWIAERKHKHIIHALCLNAFMSYMIIIEALDPPVECISTGYSQRDLRNCPGSMPMNTSIRPFKEGQVRARLAKLVAIEKMIGRDIVLIHGFLRQPHAHHLGIESNVV